MAFIPARWVNRPAVDPVRALSDEDLNRLRCDADRRRTAPPPRRPLTDFEIEFGRRGPRFPPNKDEEDRKIAQAQFHGADQEVRRRVAKMADPTLEEHLSRLRKKGPSEDDDPQNGDWPISAIEREVSNREQDRKKQLAEKALQKKRDEIAKVPYEKLKATQKRLERSLSFTHLDIHQRAELSSELTLAIEEIERRDLKNQEARDQRDKQRTRMAAWALGISLCSLAVAFASFAREYFWK
jgi:hypothetical protein